MPNPETTEFTHINQPTDLLTQVALTITEPSIHTSLRVGIIGGGTAGSTLAIRLAALGVNTYLFEQRSSLIDGPPMCHLHAGGNLYREIPDKDCIALLKECIEMVRLYPHSMDVRPTVIAVPIRDEGDPQDLIPRLQLLQDTYSAMVAADPNDKVLGNPNDYFHLYEKKELERLTKLPQVLKPKTIDEWMVSAAKHMALDKLKFPIIAVQEYGWNIFRLSASVQIALAEQSHIHIKTNTQVIEVMPVFKDTKISDAQNGASENGASENGASEKNDSNDNPVMQWQITYSKNTMTGGYEHPHQKQTVIVDYLVNACGFRTGSIDDMVGVTAERMVEFKASYVAHWENSGGQLPEIIIHGTRGTPHGMAQLTPYANGYYQIHGMTKEITLFENGLAKTSANSAQPVLNPEYTHYIHQGWTPEVLNTRSQKAIEFVSEFVPAFAAAKPTGHALYGAQQIPGKDDTLRVADVSIYHDKRYARIENIKASSTLQAADEIVLALHSLGLVTLDDSDLLIREQHRWAYLNHIDKQTVDNKAQWLAHQRDFPEDMAFVNNAISPTKEC